MLIYSFKCSVRSVNGDKVVTAAADGQVRLHSISQLFPSSIIAEHEDSANRLVVVDYNTVISVGGDGKIMHVTTLRIWCLYIYYYYFIITILLLLL